MSDAVVRPRMKGFIGLDAHPVGAARLVGSMVETLSDRDRPDRRDRPVIVIGSSGGYGLPSAVAAAFREGAPALGVCLERPHRGRTASPGWYSVAELHRQAERSGARIETVNADCFADGTKDAVVERLRRWGPPAALVYSVAAPVRTDPDTGVRYRSVLKPVGSPFTARTVRIDTGEVTETTLEPASDEEIDATVRVMGGADWQRWVDALDTAGLVEDGFRTVAFGYIGPEVTHPIYRNGTIGAAKLDLEATAHRLHDRLVGRGGGAWVSVNAAAVTQSSVAIPAVPLYLSILLAVTRPSGTFETPAEQIRRLFDEHLAPGTTPAVDDERRIRLDGWELDADVQAEVARRWAAVTTGTLDKYGDYSEFRRRFRQLFGFDVDGIDYEQAVALDVPWTT